MSNSFYNHGAFPSTGSAATSASMRAELDLVAAGFDKMPTLAGNANKFIVVNSTGTGLTQTDVLPAFTVTDTDFTVQDDGDNTRKFKFNAGSITTGNTRVYVMPDLDTTLVGTNVTQTLTNKTLTAPVIATIVNTGTLTLPTSTDTLVGRNTTDTLTNKTLTNPVIGTIVNTGTLTLPTSTDTLVGRQTTDTLTNKTISGASNTLSNIANGSLSNSSVVIGSSTLSLGGTLTTLAGVTISGASNTLSNIANASLTNSSITINGSTVALGSSVTVTATATNALTIGNGLSGTSYNGSSAVTIAINTGVTADLSTAQTFSNKTISGSANTLSNIANASLTNSAITIGSTAISLGATSLTIAGLTSASATTLISTGNQATSVAISAIGHSSGTVTVTTSTAHGLTTGDVASIDGVADYTFCGVYTVTVSNANVFTYSQTASGASSSGGFSTKLNGTWGLYAGGTGPSLANGPVMINASSQMPALRVTQGGSGYALIVEDAANPDTSAFIISNAGDLTINTNKFTVAAASGNTLVAGTLDATGNFNVNTNKFSVVAASGNTLVAGTLDATGNFNVNTNKFSVVAASGNTTIAGTTSFGGNIVSNLLFTDATYDIGASGATRPRDLFLSRNLVVGGTLTLAGGVNLNGNVTIGDASTDTLTINSTITSNLIFTDNTYDIGASGATRPRTLYLGTSLITPAITNSGLTSGRVTYATTGGLLTDSAGLTFNGNVLETTTANSAGTNGFTAGNSIALGYAALTLKNTGASGKTYEVGVGGNGTAGNYQNNLYIRDTTGNPVFYLNSAGIGVVGTANITGNLSVYGTVGAGATTGTDAIYQRNQAVSGTYFTILHSGTGLSGTYPDTVTDATKGAHIVLSSGDLTNDYSGVVTINAYGKAGSTLGNYVAFGRRTAVNTITESARFNQFGYLGLGTTNPQYLLDVYANTGINTVARFYNNTAAGNTDIYVNNVGTGGDLLMTRRANGEFWLYQSGAFPISLYTSSTKRFTVDASGRSAFGTGGPTADRYIDAACGGITLDAGSNQFGLVLNPTYANNVTATIFNIYAGPNLTPGTTVNNVYSLYLEAINSTGSTVNVGKWGVYQTGANDRNYFAGNVEIGSTAGLGRKLNVNAATDGYTMGLLQTGAYNSGSTSGIVFQGYYDGSSITDMASIRGGKENTTSGDYGGRLVFYTRPNGGADTGRMVINSLGNVSVGATSVTNPQAKLEVIGGTSVVNSKGGGNRFQELQMLSGYVTAGGSGVATTFMYCGPTFVGNIRVLAVDNRGQNYGVGSWIGVGNICYGGGNGPTSTQTGFLGGSITAISVTYNNSGYILQASVTYSGATSGVTIYFSFDGNSSEAVYAS